MVIDNFDLDFAQHVQPLVKLANERLPGRNWTVKAYFWEDNDYIIELTSGIDNHIDIFSYRKSADEIVYTQRMCLAAETGYNTFQEVIYPKDIG